MESGSSDSQSDDRSRGRDWPGWHIIAEVVTLAVTPTVGTVGIIVVDDAPMHGVGAERATRPSRRGQEAVWLAAVALVVASSES